MQTQIQKIPIALFGFNRPETFKKVLEKLIQYHPNKLYIILDGPRNENDNQAKQLILKIIETIPSTILIYKNFSEVNLGCKNRISSGISWVFEQEEMAIFLEDDCLPSMSFFTFCQELLIKYQDNEKVGLITGYNPNFIQTKKYSESYYFSQYPHIWGWATWKRFWNSYDVNMKTWKINGFEIIQSISHNKQEKRFWQNHFSKVEKGEIDTWDAQVSYLAFKNQYLTIIPTSNLIENIGFSESATHTKQSMNYQEFRALDISFPLSHSQVLNNNKELDEERANLEYSIPSFLERLISKILNYRHK